MIIKKTNPKIEHNTCIHRSNFLATARTGELSAQVLQQMVHNQELASQFLSNEFLFLSSFAEEAKMELLSILLFELHVTLTERLNRIKSINVPERQKLAIC